MEDASGGRGDHPPGPLYGAAEERTMDAGVSAGGEPQLGPR